MKTVQELAPIKEGANSESPRIGRRRNGLGHLETHSRPISTAIFQELSKFPRGTLSAKRHVQYDNRVVRDPRSLDAVIPDFLFGPLRRGLQASPRP